MSQNLAKEKWIFTMAQIYIFELTDEVLDLWGNILTDLSEEEFELGCRRYLLSDSPFFPKPGQIYALARVKPDVEVQASGIVDKIFEAISGPYDKFGTHRAKEKIGEIGWSWIETVGGWERFCKSIESNEQLPTLRSQARKSIMGLISENRSGMPVLRELTRHTGSLSKLDFLITKPGEVKNEHNESG